MQFSLKIPSDSHHFPLSWNSQFTIQNPISKISQKPFPKILTLTNSLKTSFNYESEEVEKGSEPAIMARLPVVIRRPGKVFRYFWDGNSLQLTRVDQGNSRDCIGLDDGFGKFFEFCNLGVRNFFVPQRVNENYMDYVKWKFLHRVFSSALQVLATQAMFRAIGIGYSRSLPSAAALNWVLKDGLGRLSRCIYTACLASAFDTNLKRVRFSTSVLFSLSVGVEMLTPIFPHYFLLLASVANIAKQISLACYLATNSAVHQSFATADNLGEVSAKAQIQTVCFDNLGLLLAALMNVLCKNSQRLQAGLPFVAYPIFAAIDLFGIYQGLKHVHLQTLTKNRLEIIMNTWIQLGYVPSPAEVSKEEGIDFLWSKDHSGGLDKKLWPIRIGCLDPKDQTREVSMLTMRSLRNEDFYFLCMEIRCRGLTKIGQKGILLCLREGASTTDVISGLLQACYTRKSLLWMKSEWNNVLETYDTSDSVFREWFEVVENSKQHAEADLNMLNEQMLASGWSIKNILLSTQEQGRYSFLDD